MASEKENIRGTGARARLVVRLKDSESKRDVIGFLIDFPK